MDTLLCKEHVHTSYFDEEKDRYYTVEDYYAPYRILQFVGVQDRQQRSGNNKAMAIVIDMNGYLREKDIRDLIVIDTDEYIELVEQLSSKE